MRGDMQRVEFNGDPKMFYGFVQAAALLQNLVAETVAT